MAPLLARNADADRALERLYRLHALDVYRYALGMLRNQADAEDVTQTTFMNAYRALERGEHPELPERWLIAIAHNVCRQRFRRQLRRVREVGLDVDVADQLVQPGGDDGAPSPEDIRRALGHLAFNQRSALVMRELEGRSYKEIADLLDTSVSAVETLIFRARRALREQLEASWTCEQAEQALSKQLDTQLSRDERGELRAHLRECAGCRRIARSQRAQRSALRGALHAAHLPSSLAGLFGGGGATVGVSVAAKAAAVVVAAGIAGGVGYQALNPPPAKPAPKPARPATTARRLPQTPIAAVVLPAPAPSKAHTSPSRAQPAPVAPKASRKPKPQATRAPVAPAEERQGAEEPEVVQPGHGPAAPAAAPANEARPAEPAEPAKPEKADEPDKPDEGEQPERKDTLDLGKGNPIDAVPPVQLPAPPPVELPAVEPPPGLTQTSQNPGARNDPVRHLLP